MGVVLLRVHAQWLASLRTVPLRADSSGACESCGEVEACFKEVHRGGPDEAHCADAAKTHASHRRRQWLDITLGDLEKLCAAHLVDTFRDVN